MVCGYSSSKHAIALVTLLTEKLHVELVFCTSVRTFTARRLSLLIKQHGWRDSVEKFVNVFLSSKGNRFAEEVRYINDFLTDKGIEYRTVREACNAQSVPYFSVSSLNDDALFKRLKSDNIDLLIYSGGGILRKRIIDLPKIGVLNAHAGPLPFFRGMNCVEWSLLHNVKPEVTVHLIDRGIDTGPILMRSPIEIENGDSIYSLRGKSVVTEVLALLNVVDNLDRCFQTKEIQRPEDGKQFFKMHSILKNLIDQRLEMGWKPALRYEDFIGERKLRR